MKRITLSSILIASTLAFGATSAAYADAGDSPVLKRIKDKKWSI
jgi:hypothetical protein